MNSKLTMRSRFAALPPLAGLLGRYFHPFVHNLNHVVLKNHQLLHLDQASSTNRSDDFACLDNAQS